MSTHVPIHEDTLYAFPGPNVDYGMTLRDYFAAQALTGLMSQKVLPESSALTARLCFEAADAMLKARKESK